MIIQQLHKRTVLGRGYFCLPFNHDDDKMILNRYAVFRWQLPKQRGGICCQWKTNRKKENRN